MRATCHVLCIEVLDKRIKIVDGLQRKPSEPCQGSSFEGCGEDTLQDSVVIGVQVGLHKVGIKVLVRIDSFVLLFQA